MFYPADYSIGASNLGIHYVFRLLRESGVAVERFFAEPIPYRSVDADTLLERFPIITAGVSYEAGADVFFRWLHGAHVPLMPADRAAGGYPVIGAGGAMTYINPLILSGVCDFIVLGDALDVLPHMTDCLRRYMSGGDRKLLWEELAGHPSILVPPIHLSCGGTMAKRITGRCLPLDSTYPMYNSWVTPKSVFGNSLLLELQRGCIRNCSYCTLPGCFGKMRSRGFGTIKKELDKVLEITSVQKIGLVTPEAGDYADMDQLLEYLEIKNMNVSFASLRLDRLTEKMLAALIRGGRHSITVAPETGSDDLRFSCGKKFTNELILEKLSLAKAMGIDQVKLYFMVGLPEENEEHISAISKLCSSVIEETGQNLILSVNPFVPKPGTQWMKAPFVGISEIRKKYRRIASEIRSIGKKAPQMRFTSPKEAETEFDLTWYGYFDSINLAKEISSGQKNKNAHSSRDKTLLELDSLR
ncbi:MAG: B12-binding domain-containing radical SAM protein [Synergistaceae bacterium]|nr:B12-binding domain-containing radical SAM protein [Synergistaceae bacterium]